MVGRTRNTSSKNNLNTCRDNCNSKYSTEKACNQSSFDGLQDNNNAKSYEIHRNENLKTPQTDQGNFTDTREQGTNEMEVETEEDTAEKAAGQYNKVGSSPSYGVHQLGKYISKFEY